MRETRTSGSMSGVRRRSDGAERGTDEIAKAFGNSYSPFLWQPRLTSTLPRHSDTQSVRSTMGSPSKKKAAVAARSNTEIRSIVLRYFYDRNAAATSARGKKGYAVKITDVRKELKASR